MKCEICGSNDIIKSDGVYICQHCGTKYTVEEARKLIGVVEIDKSKDISNWRTLARRAKDQRNAEEAIKYYTQIESEDPNDWEAAFYSKYFRPLVGDGSNYIQGMDNLARCLDSVLSLIKNNTDKAKQETAINEVYSNCKTLMDITASQAQQLSKSQLAAVAVSVATNSNVTDQNAANQMQQAAVACADLMDRFFNGFRKYYPDNKDKIARYAQDYISYINAVKNYLNKGAVNTKRTELESYVKTINPEYEAPKGGCYIATAVYGSYDCPEVWTLRRFRDNTLATTWYGRAFIKIYYAISPKLVKLFGNSNRIKQRVRTKLDSFVEKLQKAGVDSSPYSDR